MKTKMIWGLGILIIGLVIGLVFIGRQTDTEPEKRFILPSDEVIKHAQEANKPPRKAKEGYKWVWHHDRWDKVPIAQTQGDEVPEPQNQVSNSEIFERFLQVKFPPGSFMEQYQGAASTFGDPLKALKDYPVYAEFHQFWIDHPDFDYETATPELREKRDRIMEKNLAARQAVAAEANARQAKLTEEIEAGMPSVIILDSWPSWSDEGETE